jgi:hypothetical protein
MAWGIFWGSGLGEGGAHDDLNVVGGEVESGDDLVEHYKWIKTLPVASG